MDVSLAWLKAVAPGLDLDAETLAERLAARGAPVEEIRAVAEGIEDVVVGRVETCGPHPGADRLSLCRVDFGAGEAVPVVCGAPNVRAGGFYPFAPVGTTLPGGTAIREAEIRGERSAGMLCSPRELGLGHDHSGLLQLPEDGLRPGQALLDALALRDSRLEVEVTANRGDLLSHVGVAREVAPDGDAGLAIPPVPGSAPIDLEWVKGSGEASAGGATVRIEDPDLCHRYLGAVVRGVRVGPSPAWLQSRLRAAGARPINNVVDATNYVLLELGQPLHAFDLGKLADATVVVRRARPAEARFTTLDGEERKLGEDMLMICDAEGPVAVAGVMGGLESEVTAGTTDVLLECALFQPANVRATRRALNLSTDASYRFERGVDPAGMERALERALEIIVATAGGTVEPRVADCEPRPWERSAVELRVARVGHVLGVPFEASRIRALLEPLGFEVASGHDGEDEGVLRVAVPGWRSYDVTREIDLIEEIARTHGYDEFPADLGPFRPGTVPDHPLFRLEDELRTLLAERGFLEAQTPAFVPAAEGGVRVLNPVSREEDHLRRYLLPGLVRRVEHNWARGVRDVRLFELGTAFHRAGPGEPPREETRLGVVLTGRREPTHWSSAGEGLDLWDVRGLLEAVVARARPTATVAPGDAPEWAASRRLRPGRAFVVREGEGGEVGWAGEVTAEAVDAPAWAGSVWALELVLPAEPAPRPAPVYRPLPPFPGVERDLALLVPVEVPAARVAEAVRGAGGDLLERVVLFDLYEGEGVPEGTRSLAYRLRFQSPERTLTDADVEGAMAAVVQHLREALRVQTRG